jgi:hypothetical protein
MTEVKEFKDSYNAEIDLTARMPGSYGSYINKPISSRVLRSLLGLTDVCLWRVSQKTSGAYRRIFGTGDTDETKCLMIILFLSH